MIIEFTRHYAHHTHGDVGAVELSANVAGISIDGNELPESSVRYLLNFALQSLQDAYAGADDGTEAVANFEKKKAKLIAGEIGSRGSGGVDSFTKVCRSVARESLRQSMANADRPYKDFTAKSAEDQNVVLDAIVESNREAIEAEAKTRIAAKSKVIAEVDLSKVKL